MSTISMRVSEDELKLIQQYASVNNISVSMLIKNAVLDFIEDDLKLDEERIRRARENAHQEKTYSQEEVWEMLNV